MVLYSIRHHILQLKPGEIFTTRDLIHYGNRAAVDQALYRLVNTGFIDRLARGVFVLADSIHNIVYTPAQIAAVKAKAFGKHIVNHASATGNKLGLNVQSHQGPTFYTSGRSSSFQLSTGARVHFNGTSARRLLWGMSRAGEVVRALWHLGRRNCKQEDVKVATRFLGRSDHEELRLNARWMPQWLCDFLVPKTYIVYSGAAPIAPVLPLHAQQIILQR